MNRFLVSLVLLTLAACQTTGTTPADPPPAPPAPSLTLTPTSININAGDNPVTFSALVQNSSEAVTWTLTGGGSINPSSGPSISYTPPESVDSGQGASLTATLGTTGATATAPIAIYPADVTPPEQPPPAPPPSNPPPTDPPTDPDPPTNPNPPTEPNPPTTPDMLVTIAEVMPVTLGAEGSATVNLDATVENAPSVMVSYAWRYAGEDSKVVKFNSTTTEDVTATFRAPGDYLLYLAVTSGSSSASTRVTVTVNPAPAPEQTVDGIWSGNFLANDVQNEFTLTLDQTGGNVTGTWAYIQDVPVTGTFDGRTLTLTGTFANTPITFNAIVVGDYMEGTIANASMSFPFAASR